MPSKLRKNDNKVLELCLVEIAYPHHWGRYGEQAVAREQNHLTELYTDTKPLGVNA